MKLIRRKNTLLYLAGLAIFLFIAVTLMVSTGSTAGDDATVSANRTASEELPVTSVFYMPLLQKEPTPSPTPTPLITPVPNAPNLLPNPSFEEGWTHPGNIPEIQVPVWWRLGWIEGPNPLDPAPWNDFVRPESRLLSAEFLPPEEHDLFIWDGEWTVKIFKGNGALYFWLNTDVLLPPGGYLLNINIFPDLIVGYTSEGEKIWAPDPLSGEVRFEVNGVPGQWLLPKFGQKSTLQAIFEVTHEQRVDLTVAIRGRWAIRNNGWFMDDWSLTKMN
jgi:hypothetical protein